MSYSYQCGSRHCRQRYHFKQPLGRYAAPPKGTRRASLKVQGDYMCGRCGRGALHPTGRAIRAWNAKQATCHCGLVPYPHREGSRHGDYVCGEHPDFDPFGGR